MKRLLQGHESQERLEILLSMTSIRSDKMINHLKLHYVDGWSIPNLETLSSFDSSNFKRADTTLNVIADKYTRLTELDNLVKKSVK